MINKFDTDKAIEAVKLILAHCENHTADFHKIFKILYFAEKKHIATYGRTIVCDRYIAMKNGPVPSNLYDIFNFFKGGSLFKLPNNSIFKNAFQFIPEFHIRLIDFSTDLDVFSESEIECLKQSIAENIMLNFNSLTMKSHDSAWKKTGQNDEVSILAIAKAGGANSEMLKYIALSLENENIGL